MVSSNERIDNAAKARRGLEVADSQRVGFEKALLSAMQAQAHATLALVEQQRIANLIALMRVETENSSTPTDALDAVYERRGDGEWGSSPTLHLRTEIREGLGL